MIIAIGQALFAFLFVAVLTGVTSGIILHIFSVILKAFLYSSSDAYDDNDVVERSRGKEKEKGLTSRKTAKMLQSVNKSREYVLKGDGELQPTRQKQ